MHIPDGFLNIATVATTYTISSCGVAYAARESGKKLGEKHVPLMGIMAAFVFAAQMLNFPIAGGTSGHLLGAALAAILLGPWGGLLVMACVLIVQCLIFQDGGLLALGANIFNMGFAGCFLSYYTYVAITKVIGTERKGTLIGAFIAAWLSVFTASVLCVIELVASGTTPLGVSLPAMAGVHVLIGIVEGLITVAVLSFVLATRSDLLSLQKV